MAALLVGLSIMAVVMTMAMPVWSTAAKRAREDELVFRGEQHAHAIALYQRKHANALPPSIDVLVNERFLRRKYLDPITGGEFQALTGAVGQATPEWAGQDGEVRQDGRRTAGPWRRGADRRRGRTGLPAGPAGGTGADGRAGRPSAGHSAPAAASSASPARAPRNRSAYTTDAAPTTSGRSSPSSASCRPARSRRRAGRPGPARARRPCGRARHRPGSGINRPAGGPGSFRPPTGDGRGFRPAPAGSSVGRSRQTLPSASITASWNVGRTSVMASPVRDGCTRFVSSTT